MFPRRFSGSGRGNFPSMMAPKFSLKRNSLPKQFFLEHRTATFKRLLSFDKLINPDGQHFELFLLTPSHCVFSSLPILKEKRVGPGKMTPMPLLCLPSQARNSLFYAPHAHYSSSGKKSAHQAKKDHRCVSASGNFFFLLHRHYCEKRLLCWVSSKILTPCPFIIIFIFLATPSFCSEINDCMGQYFRAFVFVRWCFQILQERK